MASGFQTLLVPLQGTETRPSTQTILLGRSGSFALKVKKVNSTQECWLVPRLDVMCSRDEQEVAGQCRSCPVSEGFWQDWQNQCKKKPLMAVKAASDRLLIKLTKTRSAPTLSTAIEVRLVSGDVEFTEQIVWTASSAVRWLRLAQSTGTVYSNAPVAPVDVVVDATGLNDTFAMGPLNATITLFASMPTAGPNSSVFERETSVLNMVAELTIVAEVDLTPSDLTVQTLDGGILRSGAAVAIESSLTVTIEAFDFERLAVSRPGLQITVRLFTDDDSKTLKGVANLFFHGENRYRAELPGSWLQDAGSYILNVSTAGTDLETLRFDVTNSKLSLYIAAAISSVRSFGQSRSLFA